MSFEIQALFYLPEKISSNDIYKGVHWAVRHKHVKLYRSVPFVCQKVTKFPVHIEYMFYFRENLLDTTNAFYAAKLIEDCLVHRGILPDDSPKYVGRTSVESHKGDDDMCEITIKPLDKT